MSDSLVDMEREILRWINLSFLFHNDVLQNLYQSRGLISRGKFAIEMLFVIWFTCVWTLWRIHNENIFNNVRGEYSSIFEDIQLLSWKWIKSEANGFNYDPNHWMAYPKDCI